MATASEKDYKQTPLVSTIHQSPPIDVDIPYNADWVSGKTVLITGGASGFGAGFAQKWAAHGATVIIGDINTSLAETLVARIRSDTGRADAAFFVHCNVTDWDSQVAFFKEAVRLSPHGGIDCVVANAGIAGQDHFEEPKALDADAPPKPNLKTVEVNLIGVLYTTHLALFWLPRNPGSSLCSPNSNPATSKRDRHLLLLGSIASLMPIPAQALYGVSKHGVLGLFRTLRSTSFVHGIRVNILCPYFIDTPILDAPARVVLAGGATGRPEDVVDAATRFTADSRICGRSLCVGPKMTLAPDDKGELQVVVKPSAARETKVRAVWEAYAEDFEDSEVFMKRILRLINQITAIRGWVGYWGDILKALRYGLVSGRKKAKGM